MKVLAKEFPYLVANKADAPALWTIDQGDGWRQLAPASNTFIASTYFDLAGMSQREKTLFFEGAAVQEVLPPSSTPSATAGDIVVVTDVMSTSPMTDAQASAYQLSANLAQSATGLSFEQTVYGRVRIFNMNVNTLAGSYYELQTDNQTGSLEPTASDRIYCYRIVTFGPTNVNGTHSVWGARYLLQASAKEEAEFQYLMRLQRSYVLQQSHDED